MTGEIGVLLQDRRQIIGFRNWEIALNLDKNVNAGWNKNKIQNCTLKAQSFWLCEQPISNAFIARIYQMIGGKLILVNEHSVRAEIGDYPLLNEIKKPLVVQWMN